MKHLSKVLSAALVTALAVVLALALAPSAALAANYTITIKEPNGNQASHEYEAYQVFTGTYNSTSKQLEGIAWGSGVDDGTALLNALKADTTIGHYFTDATDAPTAAADMADMQSGSTDAEALAKVVAMHLSTTKYTTVVNNKDSDEITVDADGYYFVKDVTDSLSNGDTYSRFMLQVAGGDVEIEAKDTTTISYKHVKETNDSKANTEEEAEGWRNVGDYDMGDMVPFQLTGQVAADYGYYDSYYFAFEDTYDKDQLGEATDVKVFVKGTQLTEAQLEAAGYKLIQNEGSFTVELKDLKQIKVDSNPLVHAGDFISVEYKAKLLTGANIGSAGNENASHITFSNNPNNKDSRGKTPDQKVKVFTYQLVVNKVNEVQNPLKGADFTLYKLDKTNGQYKPVPTELDGVDLKTKSEDGATFTFKGLDEGVYKLEETTTPKGYNTISPIEFSIISVADNNMKTLVSINGSTESASTGKAEFLSDKDTGTVSTTIQNKSGSILPSTGGMGTTVLYVGGAALVVVAVIGLAKRRAARSDA